LGGGGPSMETTGLTSSPGGLAERRGSGLQSRIHGFESRTHLAVRAIGAAVARFLDPEEVTGSNPVSPTHSAEALTSQGAWSQGSCAVVSASTRQYLRAPITAGDQHGASAAPGRRTLARAGAAFPGPSTSSNGWASPA